MIELGKSTTRYLMRTLQLDKLVPIKFNKNSFYFSFPREYLDGGILNQETTSQLFKAYKAETHWNEKLDSIGIVVSLVSIEQKSSNEIDGLLNVPAILTKKGELAFDLDRGKPWIPRERLMTENSEILDVMVGNLSAYWRFEQKDAEEILSHIDPNDWKKYLEFADEMYESVDSNGAAERARDAGYDYMDGTCFVGIYNNINANDPIISAYKSILNNSGSHPLYDRIANLQSPVEQKIINDEKVDEGKRFLKNALKTCGSMSCKFPLADSQRRAVHAYHMMGDGEILAVSGPPGTGKTTMLQAIVAGMIVQRAIAGGDAPIIVGTSTNNQAVTNIIDSFSSVALKEHGIFDFRWLPRVVDGEIANDTIPGIAAFCPAKGRLNEYKRKGYLCEQKDKSCAYSDYSDPDYVNKATDRLLYCASEYFGTKSLTIPLLTKMLHKRLCYVDALRRDSLEHCNDFWTSLIVDYASNIQALEHDIKTEKNNYNAAQDRLGAWMRIKMDSKPKGIRGLFRSKVDESSIIAANKAINELIPNDIANFNDVIGHYKNKVSNSESHYRFYNELLDQRRHQEEEARASRRRFADDLDKLTRLCRDSMYAGPNDFGYKVPSFSVATDAEVREQLLEFDRALDVTLRYIEFWLAVHYYECRWLAVCRGKDLLGKDEIWKSTREVQCRYWSQGSMLTPCFVMTEYQLPKYFSIWENNDYPHVNDFERIDLLITDEAGQVNTPVALASFSFARKAVIVGDTHQLAPIWAFDEESDRSIAKDSGLLENCWQTQKSAGLTCSQPSSLMKAATHACKWRYSSEEAGLFLEEHYRCVEGIISFCNVLIYQGRLVPSRRTPSKLEGLTAPFLFKVVPESQDRRVGSSRCNQSEAKAIAEWILDSRDELEQIYDRPIEDIVGVVTPFSAQAGLVKRCLSKNDQNLANKIIIGTAHRLQGAEKPIILFSATYGDNTDDAGFINRNPELMNVAVSRAKDIFIMFGARKRRHDGGAVLRVINRLAKMDDCTFAQSKLEFKSGYMEDAPDIVVQHDFNSAVGQSICMTGDLRVDLHSNADISGLASIWVEQGNPKYAALGKFLSRLYEEGRLEAGKPNVQQANRLLESAGLLQRLVFLESNKESWFPTKQGFKYGIREIRGVGKNGPYANPVYPESLESTISGMFKTHYKPVSISS